jgi:hypothetical protein
MSQQNETLNSHPLADSQIESPSKADPQPQPPPLIKSETKVEIISQQVSAIDITESFIAAVSGIFITVTIILYANVESFEYRTIGQR